VRIDFLVSLYQLIEIHFHVIINLI